MKIFNIEMFLSLNCSQQLSTLNTIDYNDILLYEKLIRDAFDEENKK
jgi:hypothetical protein